MADTKYNFPHQPPVSNTICVRLCLTGKIAPSIFEKGRYFGIFYKAKLFVLRERPRCPSRTATLSFANDHVALRERLRCSSRTANKNDKQKFRNGC